MLYMKNVGAAMEFYKNAFDATEMRHFSNADGTVHVAEMYIGTALFRLHEEVARDGEFGPPTLKVTTVIIGLRVNDPDAMAAKAIAAGATQINPVKDYDYGYRQGTVADPFGHHWTLERDVS
jgi:PhnB protein